MKRSPLGRKVTAPEGRSPDVLFPIERKGRTDLHGYDLWRAYELSWLNMRGRPMAGILEFAYPASSRCIVESKSLKLYLAGLAWERFPDVADIEAAIRQDIERIVEPDWMTLRIAPPSDFASFIPVTSPHATPLDALDVEMDKFERDPSLLCTTEATVQESLYTDLFRTVCPITSQPDWATVLIEYWGHSIRQEALLRYLCSYRKYAGFAEDICSMIYRDIADGCRPDRLQVTCFYTRRGGIDITARRCSEPVDKDGVDRVRLVRQ